MISKSQDEVAWAMLMYELDDAAEHLAALIEAMNEQEDYDEAEFRIDLGHVFAHLNRAWHRRNVSEEARATNPSDETWDEWSQFPTDLNPTG